MGICSSTKSCCETFNKMTTGFQSILLLALRLYWGYSLFQSGWGKLHNIGPVVDFFKGLGIPFPEANAYISGGIECIGGALLVLGLFSRLASIPIAIVMIVALLTAHLEATKMIFSNPPIFMTQPPVTFLMTALVVLAFGPGVFSVDYLLGKICCRKSEKL